MIGLEVDWALPSLRAEAESLMVDTCRITRAGSGDPVFDPETGQYTPPARVTVYEGKCRLQVQSVIAGSSKTGAGERATVVQDAELQLPVEATVSVVVNDVAEMLTAALDPAHVGRMLTVKALHSKTHATSRRLRVMEVTG